jgi:hypothetical protein
LVPPPRPRFLLIHRERWKPGREAEYRALEEDTARIQARLGCPHPYLAIESLTEPKEIWFFNGFETSEEWHGIGRAYQRNAPLMAALQPNSDRKRELILPPVSCLARRRDDLSRGEPWSLGSGRFLVITVSTGEQRAEATAFQAPDGTRFFIAAAATRPEAEAAAARAAPEPTVFAVRPDYSFPAPQWVASDPAAWGTG